MKSSGDVAPALPPKDGAALPSVQETGRHVMLSDAARALLRPEVNVFDFSYLLVANGLYADMIRFIAHRLPPRDAVWWGCLCVRTAGGPVLPADEEAALKAVVAWVLHTTDECRRAARVAADRATLDTPAGCIARATFSSGGSLLPPGQPVVEPPPYLTAGLVASGVLLAAAKAPPPAEKLYRRMIALGWTVGMDYLKWQPPKTRTGKGTRSQHGPR